jgi:asparagine synthase (glutamine-hydrolysing)
MCGVYGLLNWGGDRETRARLLCQMGHAVRHRGPDDEGAHVDDHAAIGMRRLSIIDVAGGHQPISNEDGSVWAVCNGEIYNFQEIRTRLQQRGHTFRTRSDSEVAVHLYEDEGVEGFGQLRGMFALAIWDAPRARLVLVRDRLGKKPLYLWRDARRLAFGSEIKSLLELTDVDRRLDHRALRDYLALGYVPAPATLFEGITKVAPGHYVVADATGVVERPYWQLSPPAGRETWSEADWIERVREKFVESVRIRLISDVPLGAFLSGGLDSSAIVAVMARLLKEPVKTYTIGYGSGDQLYDERPYARLVADAFKTDHHEIVVQPDVARLLPRLIWHLDEPIADSALITTYLVARLARESVTVILSGVGGDELFGGYHRYLGDAMTRYYARIPRVIRRGLLPLLQRLPQDRHSSWKSYVRYATAVASAADGEPLERYRDYVTLFSEAAQQRLLRDEVLASTAGDAHDALRAYHDEFTGPDALNRIMYTDIKTSLVEDLLALTDKMTMAASVECRAPFVDHELVELVSHMPSALKVRGVSMKYLFKKVIEPWLPARVVHRGKRGFGAPIGAWLRHDLNALVADTLSESAVGKRGLFNWDAVRETVAAHAAERQDNTDRLLALVNLELWFRIFIDRDGADPAGCAA